MKMSPYFRTIKLATGLVASFAFLSLAVCAGPPTSNAGQVEDQWPSESPATVSFGKFDDVGAPPIPATVSYGTFDDDSALHAPATPAVADPNVAVVAVEESSLPPPRTTVAVAPSAPIAAAEPAHTCARDAE